MPNEALDDDRSKLRGYLLGLLPEDESNSVEDHFATDDAYFALYEDVERALIRDYAAGNLPQSAAECFERSYLITGERKRQLILVSALLSIRPELMPSGAKRTRLGMRLVFAFTCAVLMVASGIYLNYQHPFYALSVAMRKNRKIQAPPPPSEVIGATESLTAQASPNSSARISENPLPQDTLLSRSQDGPPQADASPSASIVGRLNPTSIAHPTSNVVQPSNFRSDHSQTKSGPELPGVGESKAGHPAEVIAGVQSSPTSGSPPPVGNTQATPKTPTALSASVAPINGLVVKIGTDETLIINVGSKAGLKIGDKLTIKRRVPAIIDPSTGQAQPAVDGLVGQLTVTEVSDDLAAGSFRGPGKPLVNDIVTNK